MQTTQESPPLMAKARYNPCRVLSDTAIKPTRQPLLQLKHYLQKNHPALTARLLQPRITSSGVCPKPLQLETSQSFNLQGSEQAGSSASFP